jgi:hypothetical protein
VILLGFPGRRARWLLSLYRAATRENSLPFVAHKFKKMPPAEGMPHSVETMPPAGYEKTMLYIFSIE